MANTREGQNFANYKPSEGRTFLLPSFSFRTNVRKRPIRFDLRFISRSNPYAGAYPTLR